MAPRDDREVRPVLKTEQDARCSFACCASGELARGFADAGVKVDPIYVIGRLSIDCRVTASGRAEELC
jgi:hypothetical protein